MGAVVDRLLSFHRPPGMSNSHFRCLIRERVNFANGRNCTCEFGCEAGLNEGRFCWRSGFQIPVGYFSRASCDGCGLDATDRCPHCQATTCGKCRSCEHGPTLGEAKCVKFYTEDDDGLVQDWSRDRVFMNPPYGKEVYAWTRKAREEAKRGALVVGLLPASCDLKWWHEDVVGHAEVRYLRGRVRFLTGGPYRSSGFFASVVVIWRPIVCPHCRRASTS